MRDVALRIYTTRLLGRDGRLVLHGWRATPPSRPSPRICWARMWKCVYAKGSGWDMGNIEPAGLPAVRLEPLRKMREAGPAFRRGHGQFPAHQSAGFKCAQSFGRNPAARLPAAQIYRPYPFDCRAGRWSTSRMAKQ